MRVAVGFCIASLTVAASFAAVIFAASIAAAQDTTAPPAQPATPAPETPATPAPETPAAPAPAEAAPPAPAAPAGPPPGWTESRGTYEHEESGLECPATVGPFTRERLDGPSDPNILGTCAYYDSKRRYAGMRVRRYGENVGESMLAIQNDEVLMSPSSRSSATVYRVTPMTMPDGTAVQRLMITVKRRGLLVDCFAIMDSEDPTASMPSVLRLCKS